MDSYITKSGKIVFHYDPVLDNYEKCERAAILKHGLKGRKITTIAVTPSTDFLKGEQA